MKHLLLLVAVVSTTLCFSQKAPLKFGEVPPEDLAMTTYDADPTADAVVLSDYGFSAITYNKQSLSDLTFERITRIKVLTDKGRNQADFTISLRSDSYHAEDLSVFRSVTVNMENGQAVESTLNKDAMFIEKKTKDLTVMRVTLPNVKVGSVIDITYRIRSDFFPFVTFREWEFQTTIPTKWSEYRAVIPQYFNYDKYVQGYVALAVNEEFRWAAQDVPAFRDEPFMTTREDYISRLNFELATLKMPGESVRVGAGNWEGISKSFAESSAFLEEVSGNASLRRLAEKVTATATTVPQKIEAIDSYVKKTVKWNGESRTLTEHSLKEVIENKRGSSAEINLLIASLLEKVGVSVKPVLLSTREHGSVREATPAARQFNYSVCQATWEDKTMLLDGTNPFLPAGYLPSRCLNGLGMAVSKNGFEWIALSAPSRTRSVIISELELSTAGILSGQVMLEYYGYKAAEQRQKYLSKGDAEYAESLVGDRYWELTASKFSNVDELKEGFKEKHNVVINEHVSTAGNELYMNPFIEGRWSRNPFDSETRQYPVDFGNAFDEVYVIKVKLPDGYTVSEMPQPKMFLMPENTARYAFSSAIDGDVITITSNLSVSKSMFSAEEYGGLREFFNRLVMKQAEQIIIRKK